MEANVFVQKGAPNKLLLGTDVQPQLGFSLVVTEKDRKVVGLLGAATSEEERAVGHPGSAHEEESDENGMTSALNGQPVKQIPLSLKDRTEKDIPLFPDEENVERDQPPAHDYTEAKGVADTSRMARSDPAPREQWNSYPRVTWRTTWKDPQCSQEPR